MAEKIFYSMGEVAEMFDVNASLIRHWEAQFSVLRPKRNKKGNRLFSPEDVENLKRIYHLVKEQGMTLDGAKKALRQRRTDSGVNRDMELLERLQRVRSLLEEVRAELHEDGQEMLAPNTAVERGAEELPAQRMRRAKPVVKIDENTGNELLGEESTPTEKGVRRPRRKKEDAEHKELFAFYEQSLF